MSLQKLRDKKMSSLKKSHLKMKIVGVMAELLPSPAMAENSPLLDNSSRLALGAGENPAVQPSPPLSGNPEGAE